METLRQGIIRPACQARRVWHVVKRPPRLPPEEFSISPFSPTLPSLPTVVNPLGEGEGSEGKVVSARTPVFQRRITIIMAECLRIRRSAIFMERPDTKFRKKSPPHEII